MFALTGILALCGADLSMLDAYIAQISTVNMANSLNIIHDIKQLCDEFLLAQNMMVSC